MESDMDVKKSDAQVTGFLTAVMNAPFIAAGVWYGTGSWLGAVFTGLMFGRLAYQSVYACCMAKERF